MSRWASVLVLGVLGCSESNKPAALSATDSGTVAVDSASIDDSGTTADSSDGGTTEDTAVPSDGTSPDDSGSVSDGSGDAPSSTCAKDYSGTTATKVTYPRSGDGDLLAAITWDELTIAWTSSNSGGVVKVHYSDRSDRDAAFTADLTLPPSLGPFPEDKVALSADGLTMLVMSADHQTLTQLTRSARGSAFDASTATTAPFVRLTGVGGGTTPRQLADLVLSKDGKTLFYTDLLRTTGSSLRMSNRLSDGTWDAPNAIAAPRLAISGGVRCRPTGISSDGTALFFYDEALKSPNIAFRNAGTTEFVDFVGYSPKGLRAMPSDTCFRVYLSQSKPADPPDTGTDAEVDIDAGPGGPPMVFTIVHAP